MCGDLERRYSLCEVRTKLAFVDPARMREPHDGPDLLTDLENMRYSAS